MKRYLLVWLTVTASLLMGVAAFNLLVDPYRIFHFIDKPGFNHIKPQAGPHGAMVKKYGVSRIGPGGLILGNSRAEVGFDPAYSAWPEQAYPAFNLALPGTGTSTSLASLKQVLAEQKKTNANRLKVVVWGVDYMDFLVEAKSRSDLAASASDDSDNTVSLTQWLRDYTESLATMAALQDSVQTVINQRNPFASDLTEQGFNPMREYIKITAEESYWAVFRAKDREGIKAYLRRPKSISDADGRSTAVSDLETVISLCKDQGIALHLVMYPYHAHLLETLKITGHWANYETWKRKMVAVVDASVKQHRAGQLSLWDFSGFNPLTAENIPPKQDKQTRMRWYWEAGHFKSALGNLMLDRIFDRQTDFPEFGVLLDPSNIDRQITSIQAQEADYRRQHVREIDELEQMAAETKNAMRPRF